MRLASGLLNVAEIAQDYEVVQAFEHRIDIHAEVDQTRNLVHADLFQAIDIFMHAAGVPINERVR